MAADPDVPSATTPIDSHHAPPHDLAAADGAPKPPRNASAPYAAVAVHLAAIPNTTVNAICGAAAGIASGVVTCPLDVIKTRLQAQGSFRPNGHQPRARAVYNGLSGTARVIWSHDGVRGMYRGLGPMLLGYIPTWAVYMSIYDYSKTLFAEHSGSCRLVLVAAYS